MFSKTRNIKNLKIYIFGIIFLLAITTNVLSGNIDAVETIYSGEKFIDDGTTSSLEIEITGGFGATVTLKNVGDEDAYDVDCSINTTIKFIGRILTESHSENTIDILSPGQSSIGARLLFFSLGRLEIHVIADASNTEKISKMATGLILGPFCSF